MSRRNADKPEIVWRVGDVRNMPDIADGSVDVAFDKGTLDAMIYGSPWDPPDEVWTATGRYLEEVSLHNYTPIWSLVRGWLSQKFLSLSQRHWDYY